jgi:thiol-disulfide isomerase/thioredoxin
MFQLDRQTTIYITIGVCVVIAAFAVYWFYFRKTGVETKTEAPPVQPPQNQPQSPESSIPTLVFFHADWCPHCTHMKDEWSQVVKELSGKIMVKDIEHKNPETANHQLKGYPTVRLFPEGLVNPGKFIDYAGDRKAQSIINFALSEGQ